MVYFILVVLLCASAFAQEDAVVAAINDVRLKVAPPCDFRAKNSPCMGMRGNALPPVVWNQALASTSGDFAKQCKLTPNSQVPPGLGQNLYVTFAAPTPVAGQEAKADTDLVLEAVRSWSKSTGYNALSGKAVGAGVFYKQLVAGNVAGVGCQVNRGCPNKAAVVVCTFNSNVPVGPAYPAMVDDATAQKQLKETVLALANNIRKNPSPSPAEPLPTLAWDDALQKAAQEAANKQTGPRPRYDQSLRTCKLSPSTMNVCVDRSFKACGPGVTSSFAACRAVFQANCLKPQRRRNQEECLAKSCDSLQGDKFHTKEDKVQLCRKSLVGLCQEQICRVAPVGELIFVTKSIVATAAEAAFLRWSSFSQFYLFATNQCLQLMPFRGRRFTRFWFPILRRRGGCRHWRQLVGAKVKQIGCAQAWKGEFTYFVCRFREGAPRSRPYKIKTLAQALNVKK
jgi:hypothetical protein